MSIPKVLNEDKQNQHAELYAKFVEAVKHAGDMLAKYGMGSREFQDADRAASLISIEIQRVAGRKSWLY